MKLLEIDRNKAFDLADELNNILIINGDGRDGELLIEEGISDSDAFIAVTGSSETNIMSCLLAKSKGVKKTIALVENIDYIHLSQEVGINAFINKKLLTADSIFRYIRQGSVMDVTGISDLDAEVLEFRINEDSEIAFKKVSDFPFTGGGCDIAAWAGQGVVAFFASGESEEKQGQRKQGNFDVVHNVCVVL